jgi:hypothetical protein
VLEQKESASISHPISHYVSFEALSPIYKAFVTSLHSNSTPCEWRSNAGSEVKDGYVRRNEGISQERHMGYGFKTV